MRPREGAFVARAREMRQHPGELSLDREDGVGRSYALQPFESGEGGERARLRIALDLRQKLVRARELSCFDQLLGEINADSSSARVGLRRERERTLQ